MELERSAPGSTAWFSAIDERLYMRLLPMSGATVADVAAMLRHRPRDLDSALLGLTRLGLVSIGDGRVLVLPLAEAMETLLHLEAESARLSADRMARLSQTLPLMMSAAARPAAGAVDDLQHLDGEVTSGGDPLALWTYMLSHTHGDLLWLRPDAWRMEREQSMVALIAEMVTSGRASRAIYPAVALTEAPEALMARARAGEQVRLLAELPTRMVILGSTHAILPEPLGHTDDPRLLVRQPALVAALRLFYEELWGRAEPIPELDTAPRPDSRRFILRMLADGHKDEYVARALGLSLRTVRRRVGELMIEFGCDTRFQAGVEAQRRGYLSS